LFALLAENKDTKMRKVIFAGSVAAALLTAAAATPGIALVAGSPASSQGPKPSAGQRITTLNVVNVSCATCAPIVKAALSRIRGVVNVSVEERAGASATARVVHDPRLVAPSALAAAVTEVGFPASVAKQATLRTGYWAAATEQ
jgi:mercuric ion binding protein